MSKLAVTVAAAVAPTNSRLPTRSPSIVRRGADRPAGREHTHVGCSCTDPEATDQ